MAAAATAASIGCPPTEQWSEALARAYGRGVRLHAGYLTAGLARGQNTGDRPLTSEVLARIPGPPMAERTREGFPDGYQLDLSGSYLGIIPGLERHRSGTGRLAEETQRAAAERAAAEAARAEAARLAAEKAAAEEAARAEAARVAAEKAARLASLSSSRSGEAGSGGANGSGRLSNRRSEHVARGDAVVLRPGSAGPAVMRADFK